MPRGSLFFTFRSRGTAPQQLGYMSGVDQFGAFYGWQWNDVQKLWEEREAIFYPWMVERGVEKPDNVPFPPCSPEGRAGVVDEPEDEAEELW